MDTDHLTPVQVDRPSHQTTNTPDPSIYPVITNLPAHQNLLAVISRITNLITGIITLTIHLRHTITPRVVSKPLIVTQ